MAVPSPDVIGADGKAGSDFTVDADDEFVGGVVFQVRVDRVRRCRGAGVGRRPVAEHQRQRVRAQDDFPGLNELVVVRIDPGVADTGLRHRIDRARNAGVAHLTVVACEVRARDRLARPGDVIGEAEPRREIVEDDARIGAREADRRQPRTAERVGRNVRGERLIVVAIVAEAKLCRDPSVRISVLDVGRDVLQVVDGVAVAEQIHLASGGQNRAVVVDTGREAGGCETAAVRDRRGVRVAPIAADLERMIAAEHTRHEVVRVDGHAVHRTDEHALVGRASVQTGRDDERRLDVGERRLVKVEHEVVADVRVLDVEEQAVGDDPLVAELVGRVRSGVPPVLAER